MPDARSSIDPPVFTVCLSGTACTRDEGERSRKESDAAIYCPSTGYIPVRLHLELSGSLEATTPSISVRGVGENDWAVPRDDSEPLMLQGPLDVPADLLKYTRGYSGGNQRTLGSVASGWAATALALHAANLAVASGSPTINFIGHSRGAVEAIMAAWFIYAYGPREIAINIFAIDPVPGTGEWYGILTQLAPNVREYVGVYSWDHSGGALDGPFMGLVPRPNLRMLGRSDGNETVTLGKRWDRLADQYQQDDPLAPGAPLATTGYRLFASRGRHGTVAGNATADGAYVAERVSPQVMPVPQVVYKLARGYLTQWGSAFLRPSAVPQPLQFLRQRIHTDHAELDAMGGGATRNSVRPYRPLVRRLSSIPGRLPWNSYYMDNVVGDPPYRLAYPVTAERTDTGRVAWTFL